MFDIDTGVCSFRPAGGSRVDFAWLRAAVNEAGFELLRMDAEVRGTLGRAQDPSGEPHFVLTMKGTGQRVFLFEGKTDAEQKAFRLLTQWFDGPERAVVVSGRIHHHAGGPPGLLVSEARALPARAR